MLGLEGGHNLSREEQSFLCDRECPQYQRMAGERHEGSSLGIIAGVEY